MPVAPRLRFHLVDSGATPAGRILEAAEIEGSRGVGWNRPRHYPLRAAVLLVQGGGIYRDTLGANTVIGPGDLILVNPRIGHTYGPESGQDWHEYYVAFEGPIFDALETCGVLDPSQPARRLGNPHPWLDRFVALFPPPRVKTQPNACKQLGGLVEFLLAAAASCSASNAAAPDPGWLAQAIDILATPGEDTADLKAVAKTCGLGYENFRKQFAAITAESPAAYRRRALIERAQRLMNERDLTDRAIASALGFCDEFHFSKTFKLVAGLSPRAWRALQQPEKRRPRIRGSYGA